MLQPPALEKFFKFPLHIARQFLSLLCHKRSECRVILVNDLIEKGLLGSVALVTTSIPIPAGRPGRHMRHVPRPCNTVFTYSLSLSGKFFYPQPKCLPLLDIASQCPSLLPDMLINFALINITDRKNEGTNTIDGNWQADEGRRYRDNVRIYF
ncbi:putative iron-regulated outer membrane virulence protein [Shigella sonnei]|nr:putative iron-regulated outer membrane virulence protein [Shigella sonnei]CSG28441.1 putative iron-regulated outer membrane virulence protein [Shigella sonnei]CSG30036.1 putative iron-regulated outer membrane virulence protein [Shigella sonnei]CSK43228.1 putative iron-regulated outer membrane virulence protein [Shigella sonnei]CSL09592.1 putative iron-regulated outer membrane virulence protein [Shigella sonnei]